MRASVVCIAVTFAVLLALPETLGDAACDCAKSDDAVLSAKIDKESSKVSTKSEEEETEATRSQSKCRNGLVSGAKSSSEVKEVKLTDEEQSRLTAEKKTATGSEKVEESSKKKKAVTVNEKKSVLIYYMVSYKKLPSKRDCESRVEYYKRIFPKENNLNVFFRKIFKSYEGEEAKAYVERIEFIFENVYPELDCRLDLKWLEQWDHYYTLKYSRKIDEKDEHYFPRIFVKLTGECSEHYKKRMAALVASLDEEDFSHVTFDDSELGYKVGKRKAPPKSVSSPSSSGLQGTGQISSTSKKSKQQEVDVDETESEIEQKNKKGSSLERQKSMKKKVTSVETEENTKAYAYRVAYTHLPKKTVGQLDSEYYKKFFGEYNPKMSDSQRNELYLRILIQYKGENTTEYVQRIDYLFDKVYPQLDIRTNKLLITLLDHYYREKYAVLYGETDEQWFERVLTKQPGETAQRYEERVECLQETIEEVKWDKVIIDVNSVTGYRLVSCASNQSKGASKKTLSEEDIKKIYAKSKKEDINAYYNRLITKTESTTEEYINKLNIIRKNYPTLELWYDKKYINLVKAYYTAVYTKKSSETDEQYFLRIVSKEQFETDVQCARRVDEVRELFPSLPLWYDVKYYDKYTKKIIQTIYKKAQTEDEITYYKRICTRSATETDTIFINRVQLLKLTFSSLNLWYDKRFLDVTSKYYLAKYTPGPSEREEELYKRIVTKEVGETETLCAQRVDVIHELFPNMPLWSEAKYYSVFTKNVYKTVYSKTSSEDQITYFKRITKQITEESDSVYANRLTLIKETFCTLPLWYSPEFLDVTTKYYSTKYSLGSFEKEEALYKRIVIKESGETEELCAQRTEVIHALFPNLPLWYEEKFFEIYTKNIYLITYKQTSKEDVIAYYARICSQIAKETDLVYVSRMDLVEKAFFNLPLWYGEEHLTILKKYYTLKYTKRSSENEETYVKRIVAKEVVDTNIVNYADRIHIVHLLTLSSPVWYEEKYYERYTKTYYATYYRKSRLETCNTWLSRVVTLLSGESEEIALKRITLIKKATSDCGCWTLKTLKKLEKSKKCPDAYLAKIRQLFFVSSYERQASSSSSCSKSASGEENESSIVIKGGKC